MVKNIETGGNMTPDTVSDAGGDTETGFDASLAADDGVDLNMPQGKTVEVGKSGLAKAMLMSYDMPPPPLQFIETPPAIVQEMPDPAERWRALEESLDGILDGAATLAEAGRKREESEDNNKETR